MVDETPPAVTMTAPTYGGIVFNTVNIAASASDNIKVAGVMFFLDDSALGPEDTVAPYEATWWTTNTTNGSHVLKAVARDGAGNESTASVVVTIANATFGQ
jgi:hypothetical protein